MSKSNKQMKIKIASGNTVIELEGDKATVLSEFNILKKTGIGKLSEMPAGVGSADSTKIRGEEQDAPTQAIRFPSLHDIVLRDLPKSEPEWIVIYCYLASKFGTQVFSRGDILELYKKSRRMTDNRRANISNNIKQAVTNDWLSNIADDQYSLLSDGKTKAEEIAQRTRAPKKKSGSKRVNSKKEQ